MQLAKHELQEAAKQAAIELMAQKLLTVKDVAELLNVSIKTVYRLVRGGHLVYVRLTDGQAKNHCWFARKDVLEFIESRRTRVQPAPPSRQKRRRGPAKVKEDDDA
ncbi:MAG: helix-turn-helix domain-containing protein [Veillonellaceae bacterium]|nr:helix-turn-helix domain-containing protein [Veillonellaceae bacterium]